MLTPLQQTGTFVSDQLRSMLEDIEARRKEADNKAAGKDKDDKVVGVTYDPPSAAAQEKINAYFFGALKADPDPMASLISRFTSALGLTQGQDESSTAFAQRLSDAVAMLEFSKTDSLGQPVKISLTSLGVSEDDVAAILKGEATGPTDPMAEMAARIAESAGLTGDEEDFGDLMSAALMSMRATLPKDVGSLEEKTGLTKLGLTAQDMIAAIGNPWGDAAQKVKNALSEQAEGDKIMTREMRKVLQRLEDVADPKSVEELKQDETKRPEPGRVEDSETRAERKQDIQNLENADKLEDVRDQQEAIKEHLEDTEATEAGDNPAATTEDTLLIIQTLAALPIKHEGDNDNKLDSDIIGSDAPTSPANALTSQSEEQVEEVMQMSEIANADRILTIYVDDIGIYDLLHREAA